MNSQRPDALRQLYWVVREDESDYQITLAIVGQEGEIPLDIDNISPFETALLDLAGRYCAAIGENESLLKLLQSTLLSPDNVNGTAQTLRSQSQPMLSFRNERARDAQYNLILSAPSNVPMPNIQTALIGADQKRFLRLNATDPYSFSLSQRTAIIPLEAIVTLDRPQQTYRRNHNLEGDQNHQPIPSAAYEAEAIALSLEIDFRLLRERPQLLHPVVAISLTDSDRTKAFYLALATAELETRKVRGENRRELWLTLPEGDHRFTSSDTILHPLASGLLTFLNDHQVFDDTLINTMLSRYQTSPDTSAVLTRWINTDWKIWANELDDWDAHNSRIVMDILRVSRIYANRYQQ